jgi:hypothetical protein
MNQYAAQARRHWQTHLPERYRQIEDPDKYFTEMGEQIAQQIQDTARAIAGPDPEQETYLAKVGRLNMARLTAEDQTLREMLPEPETAAS